MVSIGKHRNKGGHLVVRGAGFQDESEREHARDQTCACAYVCVFYVCDYEVRMNANIPWQGQSM